MAFLDDIKILADAALDFLCAGVDDTAHDIHRAGLHKVAHALGEIEDRVRHDIGENDIILSPHLLGEAAADRGIAVADAVERGVLSRGLHRFFVDIHADRLLGAAQQRGNTQNAAAAADVEHGVARLHIFFAHFQTQPRRLVTARAERETRVDLQGDPALRVDVLVPARHDHQPLTDRKRVEILLPVVAPVLLGAVQQLDLMGDALSRIALRQKCHRLGGRHIRLEIDVYKRPASVLAEQVLVDQIDMGDLLDHLLHVAVVLDVNAVGHDLIGDIARPVDIRGADRDLDFRPVIHHSLKNLFNFSKKLLRLA